MKLSILRSAMLALVAGSQMALGQNAESYTNYIIQTNIFADGSEGNYQHLPDIPSVGSDDAPQVIGGEQQTDTEGAQWKYVGANFELFTEHNGNGEVYLLAKTYVSSDGPRGLVKLSSADPYTPPRTRADLGFHADLLVQNLKGGTGGADAADAVEYRRYVLPFPSESDGTGVKLTDATLYSQESISKEGITPKDYAISQIPGSPTSKRRGLERHEIWTIPSNNSKPFQLAAATITVWPMPTGAITGLTNGGKYRYVLPEITLTYDDVYPNSVVQARIYKGGYSAEEPAAEKVYFIQGSAVSHNEVKPADYSIKLSNWTENFPEDGDWTIELVATTPFEENKPPLVLDHHTFNLDRSMKVNSAVSTVE